MKLTPFIVDISPQQKAKNKHVIFNYDNYNQFRYTGACLSTKTDVVLRTPTLITPERPKELRLKLIIVEYKKTQILPVAYPWTLE
jgi:hypothetical protein